LAHQVTIYTTPTCPWCHKTKRFLQDNKVAYEEKDVAADHDARHEMIRKSQQMGVPVIDIDGEIIIGFNEPALRDMLLAQK